MNSKQWDSHETAYCSRCRGSKKCVIKQIMHNNPQDEWAQNIFRRLGRCSQFAEKPQKQTKKAKGKRGTK